MTGMKVKAGVRHLEPSCLSWRPFIASRNKIKQHFSKTTANVISIAILRTVITQLQNGSSHNLFCNFRS